MHVAAELAMDGGAPVRRSMLPYAHQTIPSADVKAVVSAALGQNPDYPRSAIRMGQEGTPLPDRFENTSHENGLSVPVDEWPHRVGEC